MSHSLAKTHVRPFFEVLTKMVLFWRTGLVRLQAVLQNALSRIAINIVSEIFVLEGFLGFVAALT